MGPIAGRTGNLLRGLLPAARGVGPLLQRDYWAVIADCGHSPSEVVALVARRFPEFAPADLAAFRRVDENRTPLNPAVVGPVRSDADADRTVFGFRYDTLEGHIESGTEWFLLIKDHRTGEVRFRMEAAWRPGQFPNRWSRLGFRLLARRYQHAWHRLAYLRLRALVGAQGLQPLPRARRLVHEGPEAPGHGVSEVLR